MTDNQLLSAMSDMLDQKLDTRLKPIESDIREMKAEMQDMKTDIQGMKAEMQDMKTDIQNVKTEVHNLKLFQENVILPRLNTIEKCYTDTYERYRSSADKMEEGLTDIDLLKKVVSKHSKQLQGLA